MGEVSRQFKVNEVRSTADRHALVEFFDRLHGKATPQRCLPAFQVPMQLGEIVAYDKGYPAPSAYA